MKAIKLTKGKIAIVDTADFKFLNQWKWSFSNARYAFRSQRIGPRKLGKSKGIYLHRVLLGVESEVRIDHINGNKLDNRRKNLRVATMSDNAANQPKQKKENTTSKFKGVYWDKQMKQWRVRIYFNHKAFHIGLFKNELHAAMAYDLWVKDIQGIFAKPNF